MAVHRPTSAAQPDPAAGARPGSAGYRAAALVPRAFLLPFLLLTSVFALWGLANNLTDVLLATFRRIMSLTDYQTSWIQVAHFGAYCCLALPGALFVRRFTYKAGVLLGLGLFILGTFLFYPASRTMVYGHFLAAVFVLASGLSILETSANPFVLVLGDPATATRRLNLAQAFNPLGSVLGGLIGQQFILSHLYAADAAQRAAMGAARLRAIQGSELAAVMTPYVVTASIIVLLWLLIAGVPFPTASDARDLPGVRESAGRLLRLPRYTLGVVAQFFYVGAQVGVWSFTIRYAMVHLGIDEHDAASFYVASIVLFATGRFVFTALMRRVAPVTLLFIAALAAAALTLVVVLVGRTPGAIALVAVSGFMSLMFPTIYGLALAGVGGDTKLGASGLIMAILGGAVLTALMGLVSDAWGIDVAYLVPLFCFLVVAAYAWWTRDELPAP